MKGVKKHADSVQIDTIICKVMEQEDERQRDRQYDGACGVALRHRDFAFKKKSPILPIIYETKRGIKIRNKNYSFFMYKQSKRTPFRV